MSGENGSGEGTQDAGTPAARGRISKLRSWLSSSFETPPNGMVPLDAPVESDGDATDPADGANPPPNGVPPPTGAPASGSAPPSPLSGLVHRWRQRRRRRYLRAARKLAIADLGSFVYESHVLGNPNWSIRTTKLKGLQAIDADLEQVAQALAATRGQAPADSAQPAEPAAPPDPAPQPGASTDRAPAPPVEPQL